jgi:hypothetical protein
MTYRKKKASHLRELYYIIFILVLVTSGAYTIWGPSGYVQMKKKQAEFATHRTSVAALGRQIEGHKEKVKGLKYKAQENEQQARENGFAFEGELIIQVAPEQEK